MMYFNIFYVNRYNVELLDIKNTIFKQNFWKFAYLISIFKIAVDYHDNIKLAN